MATISFYSKYRKAQVDGNPIDFDTDSIKIMVLKNTYTPNVSSTGHEFLADVNSTQVALATGYAGPVSLANKAINYVANDPCLFADDITIAQDASGFTDGRYFVIFKDTGNAATSRLVGVIDAGANVGNVAGPLVIDFDATNGIIRF